VEIRVEQLNSGRMRLMDAIALYGVSPEFWRAFFSEVETLSPDDLLVVMRAVAGRLKYHYATV
jgi:hypothetical protein